MVAVSLSNYQGGREPSSRDSPKFGYAGHAHSGIPLLEGCVVSARNVVEQGVLKSEGIRWAHKP